MNLNERWQALGECARLGPGFLTEAQLADAERLRQQGQDRSERGLGFTTVGFFGATGSGKSTLVNALAGAEVTTPGLLRPTTAEVTAVVNAGANADDLLVWLQVDQIRAVPALPHRRLVLLDLPDFDSVATAHRHVAERLAAQVDLLVWVVDPQKYADRVLHEDFIDPRRHQHGQTLVVLNQIDLLDPAEIPVVRASLGQLLDQRGLGSVPVFPLSARTGSGVEALEQALAREAERARAAEARLDADLAHWAEAARPVQTVGSPPSATAERALTASLVAAAQTEQIAAAVGRSYRLRAGQNTGWLPTAWLHRFRADPLRRLGVERSQTEGALPSLPPLTGAGQAGLALAVRTYLGQAASTFPPGWRGPLGSLESKALAELPAALETAVTRVDLRVRPAWWWVAARILQWLALALALVGAGWYLAVWLARVLALPAIPIAQVEGWPVPGLLIGFGLGLGLLLGLAGRGLAALGARARTRAVRRALQREVAQVGARTVVAPARAERERAGALARALDRAARI